MEKFNYLFELYLKILKNGYDPNKPYDNLKSLCQQCEHFKWELIGMLNILKELQLLSNKESEEESQRVFDVFSTHSLFNASLEDGSVTVWRKPQYK